MPTGKEILLSSVAGAAIISTGIGFKYASENYGAQADHINWATQKTKLQTSEKNEQDETRKNQIRDEISAIDQKFADDKRDGSLEQTAASFVIMGPILAIVSGAAAAGEILDRRKREHVVKRVRKYSTDGSQRR